MLGRFCQMKSEMPFPKLVLPCVLSSPPPTPRSDLREAQLGYTAAFLALRRVAISLGTRPRLRAWKATETLSRLSDPRLLGMHTGTIEGRCLTWQTPSRPPCVPSTHAGSYSSSCSSLTTPRAYSPGNTFQESLLLLLLWVLLFNSMGSARLPT